MTDQTKETAPAKETKPKRIFVALSEALQTHTTDDMGKTLITSETHGPFVFSAVGVAFMSGGEPAFVPWSQVNNVVGWQPGLDEKKRG